MNVMKFFLSKLIWTVLFQKYIRLGSMAMINFQLVKQGYLLHVDQYRMYNVYVDLEGRANIVANMLGRLTKTTTAQCIHLLMVA